MNREKEERIREILREVNIYQVDFIECTENCGDYTIARESGCEILFCGSLDGCVRFLEKYRVDAYEHVTRIWRAKGIFSQ